MANWHRIDKSWHSIDLLPAKMPAAILFANADQTKQWMVTKPRGAVGTKDKVHKRDETGHFMFAADKSPITEQSDLEAAYFAFVEWEA